MADQRLARRVNELAILTALRALGPTSRADLARRLDVTPATASRIVADMAAR
ncbi:MAG: MarR family transcriptional regulator, partial [Hyphomicrobiales bacterium]|nr:MarR family transcriptional regulator [Hyphomicrobiales bacterium]